MEGALDNNQGTENMLKQYDHHLSGGATIYPEHMSLIENVLSDLVLGVPVLFALLTDTPGQNISWDGVLEKQIWYLGVLSSRVLWRRVRRSQGLQANIKITTGYSTRVRRLIHLSQVQDRISFSSLRCSVRFLWVGRGNTSVKP